MKLKFICNSCLFNMSFKNLFIFLNKDSLCFLYKLLSYYYSFLPVFFYLKYIVIMLNVILYASMEFPMFHMILYTRFSFSRLMLMYIIFFMYIKMFFFGKVLLNFLGKREHWEKTETFVQTKKAHWHQVNS